MTGFRREYRRKIKIVLYGSATLLLTFAALSHAQTADPAVRFREAGLPFITTYHAEDYQASPQNWAIVQDSSGVLFVGNNLGILEYDNVSWRRIRTQQRSSTTIRSLAVDSSGTIFVGAQGEFGYLAPDSLGEQRFVNLATQLPEDQRDFRDIWQIVPAWDGVYFRASSALFRWDGTHLQRWLPKTRFHVAFGLRDSLYLRQRGVGLMRMSGDSLKLLPGGGQFARQGIYALLPHDGRRSLVVSDNQGLFVHDGNRFTPFPTAIDDFLKAHRIYCALPLPEGLMALGTRLGGLVIIDRNGAVVRRVDRDNGLPDNFIHAIHRDAQGGLWVAMNNGISRIEALSPFSTFDERCGINGSVLAIRKFGGGLYAGGSAGLFRWEIPPANEALPQFEKLPGVSETVFDLVEMDGVMLAASARGLLQVDGRKVKEVPTAGGYEPISLRVSKHYPQVLFVGLKNGLGAIRREDGRFIDLGLLPDISTSIISIAETPGGELWLGTNFQGAIHLTDISFPRQAGMPRISVGAVRRFTGETGLGRDQYTETHRVGERIFFGTNNGLKSFDDARQRFIPDSSFGPAAADTSVWVFQLVEDSDARVWVKSGLFYGSELSRAVRAADGHYRIHVTPFLRLNEVRPIYRIYPDREQALWLGSAAGVTRYQQAAPAADVNISRAVIRRVLVHGDTLLFGGHDASIDVPPVQPYRHNALRFEFALPAFELAGQVRYRYRLEGFDEQWSSWSSETRKDYTNLPEGDYRFQVEAQDGYGQLSGGDAYPFTIEPPFYRTWWAFLVYAAVFLSALTLFTKLIVRRQQKLNEAQLIRERERAALREAELRARQLEMEKELEKQEIRIGIARDLHDDVSATLSSIAIFSESIQAHRQDEWPQKAPRLLSMIQESAENAREAISDIIWSINPENDAWERFLPRLQRYAADLFDPKGIQYDLRFPSAAPTRPPDMTFQRHVLLIFKEIVANIVKHADCKTVHIDLTMDDTRMGLTVEDDGKGFDSGLVTDRNGLKNIRQRVARLEGRCELRSAPGEGTRWEIDIPLKL